MLPHDATSWTAKTCRVSHSRKGLSRETGAAGTDLPRQTRAAPCSVDIHRVGDQPVNAKNFFAELQRRNVYRVAVAYGVVSWLLVQIATQVFPFFEIPNWATRLVVIVLLLGFPVALVFGWIYELTPEGIKRTGEVEPYESILRQTGRKLDFIVIAVLLVVIGLLLFNAFRQSKAPQLASAPAKSIAVLPFENLSDDPNNAFFTDGVQDEILTDLSKIADLKVISRTSVMQYKGGTARNLREIAQQLGVAHLVEGSVQRVANRVRVNAQLIDARDDAHLWAQTYDRDLSDVFAIQSEIAKTIADQLRAKILPREKSAIEQPPTKDVPAYDLYVRATAAIDSAPESQNLKENLLEGVSLLDRAIARDPDFFVAYCKLAGAHDQLYLFGQDHTPARLALAEQAINAAARLEPDAGEVHLALAHHLYAKLDYDAARREIEIARQRLPNNPAVFELIGYIDRRQGRWGESARNLERALELDPNNTYVLTQTSQSYLSLREYN